MNMMKPKIHLRTIRITTDKVVEINLFTDETFAVVEAKAKKAMAKGATIQWEDGRKEWIAVSHKVDLTKRGSAMYTWDKAGDKVKGDVILKTQDKRGKSTERQIGTKLVPF